VPLFAKGVVIGTLNIVRTGMMRSFTVGDMHSLSIMASKAASALESSMLYDELEDAYLSTIRALANSVEARDMYTRGHTDRVTHVAETIARELGWGDDEIKWLKIGGTLHDIGKIGIPDNILNKPGPLNQEEVNVMKQHPQMGAKMLDGIPFLEPILPYVLYHHERWDGRGYPHGLKGTDIPIEGRLLAIADTVDAILSDRPYRRANIPEKVIDELMEFRGVQFDPDLVDAFVGLWRAGKIDLQTLYSKQSSNDEPTRAIVEQGRSDS
jgi:putative nucleotidyltransferase with HDIG domain